MRTMILIGLGRLVCLATAERLKVKLEKTE